MCIQIWAPVTDARGLLWDNRCVAEARGAPGPFRPVRVPMLRDTLHNRDGSIRCGRALDGSYQLYRSADSASGIAGIMSTGSVSTIRWPRGSVEITDEDLLWLARSVVGETDDNPRAMAAVAWSMAQRLVWIIDSGHTSMPCRWAAPPGMTFTNLIRCFSQPVNPSFLHEGTAAQQARRAWLTTATWQQLEGRRPGIRSFVTRWARGDVPNPVPRLADFSAPGSPDVPAGSLVIGGNAFFAESTTRTWPDNYVSVGAKGGLSLSTIAIVAATTVATALVIAAAVKGSA